MLKRDHNNNTILFIYDKHARKFTADAPCVRYMYGTQGTCTVYVRYMYGTSFEIYFLNHTFAVMDEWCGQPLEDASVDAVVGTLVMCSGA
jgi:hypothetical protein